MAINPSAFLRRFTGQPATIERPAATDTAELPVVDAALSARVVHEQRMQRAMLVSKLTALGIAALLLAIVLGFQIVERDQVRANVHAYGVDLGGMTRDEARAAIVAATSERRAAPIVLTDSKGSWEVTTADLGLSFDVERALDDAFATGHTGWGASRLAVLWHLRDDPAVVGDDAIGVQGDQLDARLAALASAVQQTRVDPVLTVDPANGVQYTRHMVGRALDIEATKAAILGALTAGDGEVPIVVREEQPVAYDQDYAQARAQLARVFDGDIALETLTDTWTLGPLQIANWLTVVPPANGQPAQVQINEQWVSDVVNEISLSTDSYPQSPRVWWDASGKLTKIADGKPGQDLNEDEAIALVRSVLAGEQEMNVVELPVAVTRTPALPDDLSTLGIAYAVASATTPYGGGLAERAANIELAARLLNGTIVMPGQTFSFNGEIGPMTIDAGFQVAYGIATENGVTSTVPAEAGGICQVSTTVFQPVFSTGYQIDQRGWHSIWIPRYTYNGMVGLDATVEPSVGQDFKWTNNSPYAVLIEAYADGEDFSVTLYSTQPNWRVEIDQPVISNQKPADQAIVYQPTDTIPVGSTRQIERAQDGFDVSVTRRVFEGDQVREDQFWAHYEPARNLVLVGSADGTLPAEYQN